MDELSDENRKILTSSDGFLRGYRRVFAAVADQEEQQQRQQQATRGTTAATAANAPPDLNATYDDLDESSKQRISREIFHHKYSDPKGMSMLQNLLQNGDAKINEAIIVELAEREHFKSNLVSQIAEGVLIDLPKHAEKPEVIDGLLAAYLSYPPITKNGKKDQWGYATPGNQSYDTLRESALCSNTTVKALTGDNVHFNMFEEGTTKVECIRFGFVGNPLETDDPSTVMGDPTEIDTGFFNSLGLPDRLKDKLQSHAKRLEMIQHALSKLGSKILEPHAQALFEHFLGELVKVLDMDDKVNDENRVVNVDSQTANMIVTVHVCLKYLRSQQKQGPAKSAGEDRTLTIRSDLAVTAVPDGKQKQLVRCLYNIEIEKALDKLRFSAIRPKSQLIAESLARSIMLSDIITGAPETVLSALSDCFCIHIMLHFPRSQKAYLSHREIEPGRMVCVLAWLHLLSKKKRKGELTLTDFEQMTFIKIGDLFSTEIDDAVKKRGADEKATSNQDNESTTTRARRGVEGSATTCGDGVGMILDVPAMEEMEIELERQEMMSTFSSFQNYYRFGDPLPATEGVMRIYEKRQKVGEDEDFCEDSLRRVGLC